MSGQWEVVARNKKEKPTANGKTKPMADDKKKSFDNAPKPSKGPLDEAVNAYLNLEKDDGKKNDKEKESQTKKSGSKKSEQNSNKNEKKNPDVAKVKQPKTIEQALALISPDEILAAYQTNVGSSNVARLLDVTRLLNTKIPIDQHDEIYSTQPLNYPLTIVPLPLKQAIIKVIKEDSRANIQLFLELCLSSIANNMIKGMPATGYKLVAQIVAEIDPKHFPLCTAKVKSLMSSYQNRPAIGLSILWAIGQGGMKDFGIGFQVWQQAMVPMIDMRHYVKYVINYLVNLLKLYISSNEDNKKLLITSSEFNGIFDIIHSKRKGMPRDLELILNSQSAVLRKLYFEKSESWKNFDFLEDLLKKLPNTYIEKKQQYDFKTKEILYCFFEALRKKQANYNNWKKLQEKFSKQTSHILHFIETNWSTVYPSLNKNQLLNTVIHCKSVYQASSKTKKKDENVDCALDTCQNIIRKMSGKRVFPWVFGCFILLPVIAGLLLAYDAQRAGSFEKSTTGQYLKQAGVLDAIQLTWSKSLATSARGYKWAEKNTPHYYSVVAEFSKPYVELGRDMSLVVGNQAAQIYSNAKEFAAEKGPVVYSTIDHYIPGFLSTAQEYLVIAWNSVKEFSYQSYEAITTYLMSKVFFDDWAPEVLHAKTLQALNSTQLYAAQYYNWFYKHVDDYSKIQ